MLTINRIEIKAPAERVFSLAADVLNWPAILPHYRWVKLLGHEGGKQVVEMAAHRDGIPVRWTSLLEPRQEEGRILFEHVRGPTTGMKVEWRLREAPGSPLPVTEVEISHVFAPPWPIVGTFIAERIVGRFFIQNIAAKTLGRIKELAEAEPHLGAK